VYLEDALGADAGDGHPLFGSAKIFGQRWSRPTGTAPERRIAASQPLFALLGRAIPDVGDGGVPLLTQEPKGEREGEIETHQKPVRALNPELHEIVDDRFPAAAVAQGDQGTIVHMGQPDPLLGPDFGARPIHRDVVHGVQPSSSAQSLDTVFQLRVVVTTPRRRSNRLPVSLVSA
jgi:hypothetical protein